MKRDGKYMSDIAPGVMVAAFALFYLSQVPSIQPFNGMGATPLDNKFICYLWGGAMLFLGLWLIVRGVRKRSRFKAAGGAPKKFELGKELAEKREVIASFIALVIYVGLMDFLGFAIMTAVYLFFQILILTPKEDWRKNIVPAAITGVVVSILLYYIFKVLLSVLLPSGILKYVGL